jgi:histidyl-tRNA synthetase
MALPLQPEEETRIKFTLPKLAYTGPFAKSIEIAEFYGFHLVEPVPVSKKDKEVFKQAYKKAEKVPNKRLESYKELSLLPEDRVALMRFYFENNFAKVFPPVCIAHITRNARKKEGFLKLEIFGSNKSFAEALILHVARTILSEAGEKSVCAHINSTGDESAEELFREELSEYFREHINLLDPDCRQALAHHPYDVFSCPCETDECLRVKENAPKSVGFLSDHIRKHFMDTLEYLEEISLPYEINESLLGHGFYRSKEIFEIREQKENRSTAKVLAKGERSEGISKMIGEKKSVPIVSMSIKFSKVAKTEKYKNATAPKGGDKKKPPLIYFIQFGPDAKKQSLPILDMLRRSGKSTAHSLFKDDMGTQRDLSMALNAPYLIILGQKEATEGTIIVRDVGTRSQDIIPIEDLEKYIKKLK